MYQDILKQFSETFSELKDVKVKFKQIDKFVGYCNSKSYGEFYYVKKMRYKLKTTSSILINPDATDKTFVFLHEMTHAITPYYERKVKDKWIRIDHSDKFYKNFQIVMDMAYKMKIIDKTYTLKELKKRDNCNENFKSDIKRFPST